MEELRLPSNIKVHFAACEVQNQFLALKELGVNYGLYTAYPFVERLVFGGGGISYNATQVAEGKPI